MGFLSPSSFFFRTNNPACNGAYARYALRKEDKEEIQTDQIRLGEICATSGIESESNETYGFKDFCMHCVLRHRSRDWGDICDEDKQQNDWAAEHGERLVSAYYIPKFYCLGYADKIYVITEADRSVTTILFPHEY